MNGQCRLQYDFADKDETVHVEIIDNGTHATVKADPKTGGPQLDFQQDVKQCSLTAKIGDQTWELHGPTVWHLALGAPELCRKQLFPLLEMLRNGWKPDAVAADLEDSLFKSAATFTLGDQQRWAQAIRELSANSYSQRHAAFRRLREAGRAIVPYLQNYDVAQLDAEQRTRIQGLIAEYTGSGTEDTVSALTIRLLGDRQIWFELLDRDDLAKRTKAAETLSRLLNEKLDFDPAADAATRKTQLEKLRPRFEAAKTAT
jgi:hypothetical protein